MQITYTVQADNFDAWASRVKSTFQGKTLRIIVDDNPLKEVSIAEVTDFADRDGLDETEYLMRSEANKQHLLTALENVKAGRNIVTIENTNDLNDVEKLRQIRQRFLDSQQEML